MLESAQRQVAAALWACIYFILRKKSCLIYRMLILKKGGEVAAHARSRGGEREYESRSGFQGDLETACNHVEVLFEYMVRDRPHFLTRPLISQDG